ncbi:hypothetical protein FSP39_010485, partial [Pinctada imbricata]
KKLLSVKYQKRWCVIHEGIFYYYDGQLDRKQKGAFDLTGYKFFHLVGAENSFAFVKKGNRSFEFIASSRKDFAKWEEAMRVVNREDSKQSATSERHENYTKEKRKPRLPKGRAIPEIPEERPQAKVVNLPKRPPPPVPTSSVEEEDEDEFYMDPNEINDGGTPTLHHGANRRPPHKAVSTKGEADDDQEIDYLDVTEINSNPKKIISNSKSTPNPTIAHLLASASTRKKQKSVDNSDQEIDNGYAEFIADVKTKPEQSDDVGSDESDIYLDYGDDVDDMEDTHDSDSGRQMYAKPLKRNISADSAGKDSDSESSGEEPSDMYEDVDDVDVSSVVDDFNKTHSKPKREIPRPVISEDEDSFDNNDSRVSPSNGNSKSKEVPQMLNPLMQEMKQKMNIKEKPSRKPVQRRIVRKKLSIIAI